MNHHNEEISQMNFVYNSIVPQSPEDCNSEQENYREELEMSEGEEDRNK